MTLASRGPEWTLLWKNPLLRPPLLHLLPPFPPLTAKETRCVSRKLLLKNLNDTGRTENVPGKECRVGRGFRVYSLLTFSLF